MSATPPTLFTAEHMRMPIPARVPSTSLTHRQKVRFHPHGERCCALAFIFVLLAAPHSPAAAQASRGVDVGVGVASHLVNRARSPDDALGVAATLGADLMVRRTWVLGVRWRGILIPDAFERLSRHSLSVEVRRRSDADDLYLLAGVGLALATVVTMDRDDIGTGDNSGWVALGGVGYAPPQVAGRHWALELALLRHAVLADVAWAITALVRLRPF